MSFFGFFGKAFRAASSPAAQANTQLFTNVGAGIAGAYNPGLGALIELIGNAIYHVEESAAAGMSGTDKKDQVKHFLDVTAPVTISVLAGIGGKPIADPAAVAPVLDVLIDDVVKLFHAIGVFTPHHAATPPAS